ncbi:GH39 family glycosyl hydrolase [Priestia megaterium]|uniref:GH39 family glycosyl hydrolase n=1 Tax=Priestia megaterium TaxID=1404 RepID=UPI0016498225|nr:glycosyl hydrolase [Priestia megaterium]
MTKISVKYLMVFLIMIFIFVQLVSCQGSKEHPPMSKDKEIPKGIGVNIHGNNLSEQEVKKMKDAGVDYIRVDLFWNTIEKKKGHYDFREYDKLNKILKENNIRPYYILSYSNNLYEKNNSIVTEQGRNAFGKYVKATVKRFKGQNGIWEIWNEPNLEIFWNDQPSYKDYGLLVNSVAPIIKKYDQSGILVAPAISGISDASLEWLKQLFKNKKVVASLDAISVHPYRNTKPETVLEDYVKLKGIIEDYGHRDLPIISGEWGYPVNTKTENVTITEQKQAEFLSRMLLINASQNIRISIWYDWRNDGLDPNNNQHNFGLLTHEYKPKQSYFALVNFNRVLKGYSFNKRLEYAQPNDYVLEFTNNKGRKVLVFWTTKSSHYMTIDFPKGKGELISTVGEKQSVKWNQKQVVLELSSAPTYLIIN